MHCIKIIAVVTALALFPVAAHAQSAIVENYLKSLDDGDVARVSERADAILAATPEETGLDSVDYYELVLDIARTREEAGDAAGAENAYRRALSFGEAAFGADSLRLREALRAIARLEAARGDILGAEKTLLRSKAIAENELGPGHPSTRDELELLAVLVLPVKSAPGGEDRRGDYESSLLRIDERARQAGEIIAQGAGDEEETCVTPGSENAAQKVVVYYGTNRKASGKTAPASFYQNEYDRSAPVKYGAVTVSLPCDRELGAIPTPQLFKLEFRANPAKHVVLESVAPYAGEDAFWSAARKRMERSQRKEALVFIHGFNVDFEGAAMRTAQLAADVDLDGAPFFYDWPSKASLFGYNADRNIATDTPQITQDVAAFLQGVAEKTGAERISVIAHSMGNEPLLRALKLLAEGPYRNQPDAPFDEVIFASPDVNVENFKTHVKATRRLAGAMTLYASERDLALKYSSWRSDFPRAGFAREKVVVDGLVSVDTTKASSNFIGHDDFAGNGLDDLRSIIWFGAKPDGRCVLSPLPNPKGIWDFSPKCEDADFKLAVTLLRRRGLAQALADLDATREAALVDQSLSQTDRKRRVARAKTVEDLIQRLQEAFSPTALRARYAAIDATESPLKLADLFVRPSHDPAIANAAALANIDAAVLDDATAAAWRRYLVTEYLESDGDYADAVNLSDGVPHGRIKPLKNKILRSPILEGVPLIEVQAQEGDQIKLEWDRLNSDIMRLNKAGDYVAATQKAEEALRLAETSFGKEHPRTLVSLNILAMLYRSQGRYAEAEAIFLRVLEASNRVLGDEHALTIVSAINLAFVYFDQGRYSEAEPLFLRALESRERTLGKDHPDTIQSANNLAGLYYAQRRYAEAEPLYKRALEAKERVLGKDHPSTLASVNDLAQLYYAESRYAEAASLYERMLETRERVLGKDHPSTLNTVNNLAFIYYAQGRYGEAEPLCKRALEAGERTLGSSHPLTLATVDNLAALYLAQGRFSEAEQLYRRVVEERERILGRDHPETLVAVVGLAGVYLSQLRVDEAEALYRRAIEASERTLGADHPDTLAAVNNLALLYKSQARYAEAEALHLRVRTGFERTLGKDHPDTIVALNNLASLYQAQGRYEKAEPLYVRAIEARERVLGPEHPSTLISLNNLASLYRALERYGDAEQLFRRALDASERVLRDEHPTTLVIATNLARLYWAQNRYAEAEPLFVRVLEARERLLGAEHPDVLFSLEFYLSWRAAAARDGLKSFWRGDEAALRLLRELLPSFDRYLAGGANAARLPDPSSREARASRLFSAFEQARFSGVAGSDDPQIVSSASALSQRFNLSSVAAALSASSQRLADPKRRALLDERTRLGREIDDRFKALAKLQSAPTRVPAGEASIQADIEDLQKQAAAITAELRDGDQGQAEIDGVIVEEDLAKVGAALGADEALVAYTSVGGRYLAFVTTRKGSTAVSLDVERDAIAKEVTALRGGLRLPFRVVNGKEIASNNPNDLPAYDLEAARMLHAQLIAPLTHYLAGVKRLVIVPDGPLQSLPFGVLVEDVGDAALMGFERYQSARYLIDRYAVSMQPSVSAIRALRAKTPRAGGDLAMLGFADPALGGVEKKNIILPMSGIGDAKRLEDLPELPQMKSLLSVVGAALKARPEDLRFREKAQEADFRAYDAALPRYRMLTFATHGLVSNEIKALNLEEPALVMSLPPAKAGQKRPAENDGLLRASDIVGFEMDADLVILAACNTAAADGTPGAEPLSGLAKAFMAKGARALLVSHWQADANSSAVLIPAMARYAETDGFAVGLAKAQRDLRANAAFDPDPLSNTLHHAHPAIWGAFTLIGDPGR